MFTRKQQKHIHRLVVLALSAFILNASYPTGAHAQVTPPSDQDVNSNAVSVEPPPTVKPAPKPAALPVTNDKPAKRVIKVRASAYSSTVDQTDASPFTTASGTRVHNGTLAMNGIPFGTKVKIPSHFGDRVFVVEDRMHRKWGTKRVDIWMPTRTDAIQWGVRTVTVEILKS